MKHGELPRISRIGAEEGSSGRPDHPNWELTEGIIGAALEVHRHLGFGFLESVYQTALAKELTARGLNIAQQLQLEVLYKNEKVGVFFADLVVEDRVICELKAVRPFSAEHEAQLLHYLRATRIQVGLLLNFGTRSLQVKRMIFSDSPR